MSDRERKDTTQTGSIRYRAGDIVLVRHGRGSQVAIVLEVKGQSFLGRKWLENSATLATAQWIPLRRIVGRPAKDDPRPAKVRAAMEEAT